MPLVAASFTSDLCRLCDFDVAKISTFFVTSKYFCNYFHFGHKKAASEAHEVLRGGLGRVQFEKIRESRKVLIKERQGVLNKKPKIALVFFSG